MKLDHMLSFDEGGAQAGFYIEIEREQVVGNIGQDLITAQMASL